MRTRCYALTVLALLIPSWASAQSSACYDGFPLGFTLPDSTVAYLAQREGSHYIHAYLLQLVLDEGSDQHPLTIEARRFSTAPADSAASWYAMAPTADNVLCAIRTESNRRQQLRQLGGKFNTALQDVTNASGRPLERLAALGPGLRQLREDLRDNTALPSVPALGRFIAQSDTAQALLRTLASAQATRDQADRAVASVCPARVSTDSLGVALELPECATARTDSVEAHARFVGAHARFTAYRDIATAALQDLEAALSASESASVEARAAIRTLAVSTPGTRTATIRPTAAVQDAPLPTVTPLVQTAPPRAPDAILWALTDFLIARAQEEVVTTYLSNANSWFDDDAVTQTFRDTHALAEGIIEGSPSVPLSMWRTALVSDFRAFPRRLITDPALGQALLGQRYAELRPQFINVSVVVDLAEDLADGTPPLTLFERLPTYADSLTLGAPWTARVQTAAQLTASLAQDYQIQGLRTFDTAGLRRQPGYVLSVAGLLGPNQEQGHLYARLLLAHVFRPDGLAPIDPASLHLPGFDVARIHDELASALQTIEATLQQVETLAEGDADDYVTYINSALQQLETVLDLAQAHGTAGTINELDTLVRHWDRVTTLYADLHQRAYADALTNALLLFHDVADSTAVPTRFFQVASLAASVASAQDGTQLQTAFRAAALPTGSRRAKREGKGSRFFLNAYLGGAGGAETVLGQDGDEPYVGTAAVALPLGVEARLFDTPVSLFLPLIDLGALASYRFENESSMAASGFPEANLGQVIAPGAYLTVGLPSQPVALGVGVQLAPRLRSIQSDGMEDERADVLRIGAFLGVDLPLLGF